MHPDFWLARWQRNETGFHLPHPHTWLVKHFAALQLRAGDHVFVPLCGKAHDLRHLADLGMRVTGIELSLLAAEAFFHEQGLDALHTQVNGMPVLEAGNTRIFCGDFFRLTADMLGAVDAVFDRAALVALPPDMRRAYAAHLGTLTPAGTRYLLIGFDYPQAEMNGPPFSVPQAEIRSLFGANFDMAALDRADILDAEPRFRERGLSRLTETCWLLRRR